MGFMDKLKELTQPYDDDEDFFEGADPSFKPQPKAKPEAPASKPAVSQAQKFFESSFADDTPLPAEDPTQKPAAQEAPGGGGGTHYLPSRPRRIFCPHGQKTGASVADFRVRRREINFNRFLARQKVNCRKAAREAALGRVRQKTYFLARKRARLRRVRCSGRQFPSKKRLCRFFEVIASRLRRSTFAPERYQTPPPSGGSPPRRCRR